MPQGQGRKTARPVYNVQKNLDRNQGNDVLQASASGIAEGFAVFLKISIVAGFIIALPIVLYQTWAFIAPGLIEREKKYAIPSSLLAFFSF